MQVQQIGKMGAEFKGIFVHSLCGVWFFLMARKGQEEAKYPGGTQEKPKYVPADAALWTNSGDNVACGLGKHCNVCAGSVHISCKMPTVKEDREKQKRGCGTG